MSASAANDTVLDKAAADEDLVKEGKNKTKIICQNLNCKSVVLLPGIACRVKKEFYLPHMRHKKDQVAEGETLADFWLLDDMMKFENVGFTNTVKMENTSIKYLACADCEIGPIGLHDVSNKTEFYVAIERVTHED